MITQCGDGHEVEICGIPGASSVPGDGPIPRRKERLAAGQAKKGTRQIRVILYAKAALHGATAPAAMVC